jgi:hypothetical protein
MKLFLFCALPLVWMGPVGADLLAQTEKSMAGNTMLLNESQIEELLK